MGLLRTLFLGDLGNCMDIEDARRDVERTRSALHLERTAQRQVDDTQDQRLATLEAESEALEAAPLARLLVRRGVMREADLEAIISVVDRQ
jgi:hypothetical protein